MALYTIFAWTAIVVAGGAYYWIYVRREPIPLHLLGLTPKAPSPSGEIPSANTRKRKQKEVLKRRTQPPSDQRLPSSSHAESVEGEGVQAVAKSVQKTETQTFTSSAKDALMSFNKKSGPSAQSDPSDADESDSSNTPTPGLKADNVPVPISKVGQRKTAADTYLEKATPKTIVDDMIPPDDRPAMARVLRISSPSQEAATAPARPSKSRPDSVGSSVGKDGLTKKQRQNQKKKERHREARAREEAARLEQLRAHQKQLETIRLNNQIKAAEKRSSQTNAWQSPNQPSLQDSVYTVQNLSDENLTIVGHPSDGAASEEGWQEVTSRAAKRAASKSAEKSGSGTEASEESFSVGESDERRNLLKSQP